MTGSGEIINITQNKNSFKITCKKGIIKIEVLKSNIIRIKGTYNSSFIDTFPTIIDISKLNTLLEETSFEEKDNEFIIKTERLIIDIEKKSSKITIKDNIGNILQEDTDSALLFDIEDILFSKKIFNNTYYYGLGERFGNLEARGQKRMMYNSDCQCYENINQLYASIPFLLTSSTSQENQSKTLSCGLYIDIPSKTIFDFTDKDKYTIRSFSGYIDSYFIYEKTPKRVIETYTELTGRMEMPPIWSLGYHQSRWGYKNFKKIKYLVETFRKKQIPCDAIHLDIQYMNGYRVFTWDEKNFPEPESSLKTLLEKEINIVTIIDPGVKKDDEYNIYYEGVSKDLFCKTSKGEIFYGSVWPGTVAFPDFFMEKTRDWWAMLVGSMSRLGVSGIWNDMNEPVLKLIGKKDIDNPDIYHNYNGETYKHNEIRNLYANYMARATHLGLIKEKSNERPFILSRSGFAGIQKYSAIWTGDIHSTWEHLRMVIPMLLNLSLSGISFCGADVGGFASGSVGIFSLMKWFKPSPELFARWIELSCLTPFFRTHTVINSRNQEPWSFGKVVEDISRKYISLRYQLLPYLYNCFYLSHQTGTPIMRPLFLNYPEDINTYNIDDEFFVGDDLLIAPIVKKEEKTRNVYLPEGEWVNYHTGDILNGMQDVSVEAELHILPLFIRKGAIIPKYEAFLQSTKEIQKSILIVDIYIGEKSKYELYEDDGKSMEYKNEAYSKITFSYINSDNTINFNIKRVGSYLPFYKIIKLTLRCVDFNLKKIILNYQSEENDLTKEIVKVSESINYKANTGMCWFIESSSINRNFNNDIAIIIPNKRDMDISFEITKDS